MIDFQMIMNHIAAALPMYSRIGMAVCSPSRGWLITGDSDYESRHDTRSCDQILCDELSARADVAIEAARPYGDVWAAWCRARSDAAPARLRSLIEAETATVAAMAERDGTIVLVVQRRGDGTAAFWQHVAYRVARHALGLPEIEPETTPEVAQESAVEWAGMTWYVVPEEAHVQ